MNTMKKEDMITEKNQVLTQMGVIAFNLLHPFVQLFGGVQRVMYLQAEIDKVTPKPAPIAVAPEEKKEEKSA